MNLQGQWRCIAVCEVGDGIPMMNVLIAIDDSDFGKAVLETVLKHHWGDQSQFTVIHVVEPLLVGSYMSLLPSPVLDEIRDKRVDHGKQLVHEFGNKLSHAFPDAHIDERVVQGFPGEDIVDFASAWPADFIVVGSHGRRGVTNLLLGSVSQAVCAKATCPVMVVRPSAAQAPAGKKSA